MAITAPNSRQKGLKAAYLEAYSTTGKAAEPFVDSMFYKDTSDGAFEDYNIPDDGPGLLTWRDGDPVPEGGQSELTYQVGISRWGREVSYSMDEAADNRSAKSHAARAREIGNDAALLDERCLYSLLSSTTSADALEEIPLAFDGLPLFSTSHREHAFGNVVGFQNQDADSRLFMQKLVTLGVGRFRRMIKPITGRKLFSAGEIDRANFWLLHAPEKEQLVIEAFDAMTQFQIDGTAGSANAAAGVDNAVGRVYRGRFRPYVFGEMSASDGYYLVMELPNKKPFLKIDRQGQEFKFFGPDNDGVARQYKREGMQVNLRRGYGVKEHFVILHIDPSTAVQ